MTKEQILERIKELETNRESMKGNFIAIEGALQDCQYWLTKVDVPATAETPTEAAPTE